MFSISVIFFGSNLMNIKRVIEFCLNFPHNFKKFDCTLFSEPVYIKDENVNNLEFLFLRFLFEFFFLIK